MLEFARWKYLVVGVVSVLALVFAPPNFFGEDLAAAGRAQGSRAIDAAGREADGRSLLKSRQCRSSAPTSTTGRMMVLFDDVADQLAARDAVNDGAEHDVRVRADAAHRARRRSSARSGCGRCRWVSTCAVASTCSYQVDVNGAISQLLDSYEQDFRRALTDAKIPFTDVSADLGRRRRRNGLRVTLPAGRRCVGCARCDAEGRHRSHLHRSRRWRRARSIEATLTDAQLRERQATRSSRTSSRCAIASTSWASPSRRAGSRAPTESPCSCPACTNSAEVKDMLGKRADAGVPAHRYRPTACRKRWPAAARRSARASITTVTASRRC